MVEILNINEKIVSLLINNDSSGCYSNTEAERLIVKEILDDNNSSDLWDENILPIWGNNPTIETPIKEIDIESLRKNKQLEIKQSCHNKITEGISIDLGLTDELGNALGELHYTLSEKNQTDMRDLVNMIAAGTPQVTWRDDSRVTHMVYSAEQFMSLYQAATVFILKCRFHSDGLEALLFRYTDDQIDDIQSITWDTELPGDIQNQMDSLLAVMLGQSGGTADETKS